MKFTISLVTGLVVLGLVATVAGADYADLNGDGIVNLSDFSNLAQHWRKDEPSVDIAPLLLGDGIINFKDLAVLAEHWLQEQIVHIQWLGHASVKIWTDDAVIYVDPRNLSGSPHDATLVLVTHQHTDHYSASDIAKVSGPATPLVVAAKVVATYGVGQAIAPGQTFDMPGIHVLAVRAYNINKTNHPKSDNLLGFIIELASKRIYVAGDTDLIPEMQTLGKIDVAFLPAGGTYTMNATEAAQAATIINPTLAIPYHWGTIVGTLADAQLFARLAGCNAKVMTVGEILSSQDWKKDFSLVAHWKLDEAAGTTAHDSAGSKDGTLNGNPLWLPASGKIDGALQFDGVDDYVSTPLVVNPADGPFSVFAWIKGGGAEQAIISQAGGVNWLAAGTSQGKLMTELKSSGRLGSSLFSETVIIDGEWHHVGFTWDNSTRILYVDDVEVARDAQAGLVGSTGGLYIGAGSNPGSGNFWSGLIDDVRIHNRAVKP